MNRKYPDTHFQNVYLIRQDTVAKENSLSKQLEDVNLRLAQVNSLMHKILYILGAFSLLSLGLAVYMLCTR